MSDIMDKLLAEEKEAEELMYGSKEETPLQEALSPDAEDEEMDEQVDPEEDLDSDPEDSFEQEEKPTPKPKRENWKKRYIGYKSATDNTISDLRSRNHDLTEEVQYLRQRVDLLEGQVKELERSQNNDEDIFKDVFTQEDVDMLGPEALAAMKKAALATQREPTEDPKVKQLEEELNRIQKRDIERAKAEEAAAQNASLRDLRVRLSQQVDNFEALDNDERFKDFLQDADTYSDALRMDLFTKAVNGRDVAGAARFYREFADSIAPNKESFVDDYITPEGDAAPETPSVKGKKTYHISEYEQFMNDQTRGKYRGKEQEARKLERMFDKAFVDGRIYE